MTDNNTSEIQKISEKSDEMHARKAAGGHALRAARATGGAILFVVLSLLLIGYLNERLRLKTSVFDSMTAFYREPDQSLDFLFVGSSHMYRGISPMYLWERDGIPSYALATPAQSIPMSYYAVMEALKHQHPKAVVWDVYSCQYEDTVQSRSRIHPISDALPWGETKIRLFREFLRYQYPLPKLASLAFPLLTYHDRWTELERRDFEENTSYLKGFSISYQTKPEEAPKEVVFEGAGASSIPDDLCNPLYLEYLDKMIALCEENDVDLILCQIPMSDWENFEQQRTLMLSFMEHGRNAGVPVLDLQALATEYGLDFQEDFKDHEHLNTKGAYKVTEYVADYLKDRYELRDHRGEALYGEWDERLADYWAMCMVKAEAAANGTDTDEDDEEAGLE